MEIDLPDVRAELEAASARYEQALYRIAQEALSNVRQYAQAAHVDLLLHLDQQVSLMIAALVWAPKMQLTVK